MITTYKILFMLELLHDFYKNGQCTDFRIVPSAETALLLRNCKAIHKMIGNKLVVLIKTDTSGKPYLWLVGARRLVRFLHLFFAR